MDLVIDDFSRVLLSREPLAQIGERNVIDRDFFPADTAALMLARQIRRQKQMHNLRGHPGRSGTVDEPSDFPGAVAGLLKQLATGRFFQ